MKRDNLIDLTALLDVILIILFAVMLNMNTSAESASDEAQDKSLTIEALTTENNMLTSDLTSTENQYNQLMGEYKQLKEVSSNQSEADKEIIQQYQTILELYAEINGGNSADITSIAELQGMTEAEQKSTLKALTDTNVLMENLHKYEFISGSFEFIDLSFNLDTGMLLYDDEPTGILITDEDTNNERLSQLKTNEIVTYLKKQLQSVNNNRSFILITIKFDAFTTKRSYVTLISDTIDNLRETYQDNIIFDTLFLIP